MAHALVGFSKMYLEDGDGEEAIETVEEAFGIIRSEGEREIRDSKARYQVFGQIAIQFAAVGKFERAMEIAQQNPDPVLVRNALVNIAQVCVLRNEDELARQALAALDSESERVWGLLSASDAKNSVDRKEEAAALLDEASEQLDTVPQLIIRAEIGTEIAKRYQFYGQSEKSRSAASQCLATIQEILGGGNRAIALCELSDLYEKHGFEESAEDKQVLENIIRQSLA